MQVIADGRRVDAAELDVPYDRPGLYSEELIVRTDRGDEDRDYLQVRIYDPERPRPLVFGWFYHWPVRGIFPNTSVEFHNCLMNSEGEVSIDFGDGTAIQKIDTIANHSYQKPGVYSVSLKASGERGDPAEVRMRVVVERAR